MGLYNRSVRVWSRESDETGLFLPARDLGPNSKEVKLLAGSTGRAVQVFGRYDEGAAVALLVGGGHTDPAWFLCNCEGPVKEWATSDLV